MDEKLKAIIGSSTCFGIAYDDGVPECKQCDTRLKCRAKTLGVDYVPEPEPIVEKEPVPKPELPKVNVEPTEKETKKKTKKGTTEKAPDNPNLPNFKEMSLEQLKSMAAEKSVEWKDYGNDQITRMRLIMALKKAF